ncbi:MAG: hypothetical protein PVJ52_02665, partial [Candidatus Woesebacteria bacterium]
MSFVKTQGNAGQKNIINNIGNKKESPISSGVLPNPNPDPRIIINPIEIRKAAIAGIRRKITNLPQLNLNKTLTPSVYNRSSSPAVIDVLLKCSRSSL